MWSPDPAGSELSPALVSPPRSGKYNTWKEASKLCTPEPKPAGYKKKTYRRHPSLICGQILSSTPGNFSGGSRGRLRTHCYSWSPSMGRNRLGYVTHASLLSQTFLLVVSFPKPGKKAEGAQRVRPKAGTTCPRGPRVEGRGIDVAYAFWGNSGYCSSSLRETWVARRKPL